VPPDQCSVSLGHLGPEALRYWLDGGELNCTRNPTVYAGTLGIWVWHQDYGTKWESQFCCNEVLLTVICTYFQSQGPQIFAYHGIIIIDSFGADPSSCRPDCLCTLYFQSMLVEGW
jgi:hypothetical protein